MNTRQVSSAVQVMARFGYAAKGVVYMLIGVLTLGAVVGWGTAGDSREAMSTLNGKPIGEILLAVIGFGLIAYALWSIYSAVANPERDKTGSRIAHASTGLINGVLGLEAVRMTLFSDGGHAGNKAPHWTAEVMSQPFGVWLVAGGGLAFLGYGIGQMVRAFKSKLDDQLHLREMKASTKLLVRRLARLGLAARGIVFGIVGVYLVKSALASDPSQARDLGASLQAVHQQPFGKIMLGIVAAGLFLYGFYNLVRARYRIIQPLR